MDNSIPTIVVSLSLTLYFSAMGIMIFTVKPSLLFDKNGKLRDFGLGDNRSIISLHVAAPLIAILSISLSIFIVSISRRKK